MSLEEVSVIVAGVVLTCAAAVAKRLALTALALLMLALLVWCSGAVTDVTWPSAWY